MRLALRAAVVRDPGPPAVARRLHRPSIDVRIDVDGDGQMAPNDAARYLGDGEHHWREINLQVGTLSSAPCDLGDLFP